MYAQSHSETDFFFVYSLIFTKFDIFPHFMPPVPTCGSIWVVLWLSYFRSAPSIFPLQGHFRESLVFRLHSKLARSILALKLSVTTTILKLHELDIISELHKTFSLSISNAILVIRCEKNKMYVKTSKIYQTLTPKQLLHGLVNKCFLKDDFHSIPFLICSLQDFNKI